MTTAHNIDLPAVLAERLTTTHPDVLRELLATFIHTLMGAEADALCGAGYGERSTERTNSRNGYRHRQFDTRAGSLDLAIPKLRQGSYFPEWLPFPRRTSQAPGWEGREGRPSHRVKSSIPVGWAARRSRCAALVLLGHLRDPPGLTLVSISARRIQVRGVSAAPIPNMPATAVIAAHCEGYCGRASATMRTARSRSSSG